MWKNIVLNQGDTEINSILLTLRKKTLAVAKTAMLSTKSDGRRHGPKNRNRAIDGNDYDILTQK